MGPYHGAVVELTVKFSLGHNVRGLESFAWSPLSPPESSGPSSPRQSWDSAVLGLFCVAFELHILSPFHSGRTVTTSVVRSRKDVSSRMRELWISSSTWGKMGFDTRSGHHLTGHDSQALICSSGTAWLFVEPSSRSRVKSGSRHVKNLLEEEILE